MMAKVIIGQLGVLPGLAEVHGQPLAVRVELGPAMITSYGSFIRAGRNREPDGEAGRHANRARQRDEVSMKIRAIARARIAGIDCIAPSPTRAALVVLHSAQ